MSLTTQEALRMIEASQEKATSFGAAVSTAVVDAGGHLLALARMERAPWLTADSAHAMAYTAAGFRMPGAKLARFASAPWFMGMMVQSGGMVVAADGCLPVTRDGAVLGAIACSGASDEQDVACAEAGISAL
jgi:uncharacterized protein GlcG (DUF336 family)